MVIMNYKWDKFKFTIHKKYNDLNEEIYCEYVRESHVDFDINSILTIENSYTHHKNGKIAREIKFIKLEGMDDYYTIKDYDEKGNCIHFVGEPSEEFFEYDEHNHVIKEIVTNNKSSLYSNTTDTNVFKNTYDNDGDITKVEYPDGKLEIFEYYDFE
mgnify:CR=1 FL=1